MYNRYIPQSDGSFQRSRVNDQRNENNTPLSNASRQHQARQFETQQYVPGSSEKVHTSAPKAGSNVEGFLRQLLPKDFDTGDLLVILLLLLMSGDSKENQNSALLTLALYLFM